MAIQSPVPPLVEPPAVDSVGTQACHETELVSRAKAGHREACNELLRRHRQSAYLLALQLMGNADDALDVTQEVLLRFFTTLHRFDARRPVKPWLLRIVRNQVVDLWRRQRVRRAESLDEETGGVPLQIVDAAADPEGDVLRAQLRRRVWEGVCKLPHAKREILVLRDFHDLSYAEIAQVLDIPLGTVMSRLHGARKQLRDVISQSGRVPGFGGEGSRSGRAGNDGGARHG